MRLLLPVTATAGETECHPDPPFHWASPMPNDDSYSLVFEADIGIKSAQDVAASLKQAVAENDRIVIDTRLVTAADITTVQTFLAARATAERSGKALEMRAPIAAPLATILSSAGFLSPGQEHAGFWTGLQNQQAEG